MQFKQICASKEKKKRPKIEPWGIPHVYKADKEVGLEAVTEWSSLEAMYGWLYGLKLRH